MNIRQSKALFLLVSFLLFSTGSIALSAVRTSAGLVGTVGEPTGWWSERWAPMLGAEMNLRYEVSPGTGILLLAGLRKAQFADLSASEIVDDSHLRDISPEFAPYSRITLAKQGGSFRQIPVGFGLYMERLAGSRYLRGYGSAAMVVHLWKFDRSQSLTREISPPGMNALELTDNWSDKKDGSDLGAQVAVGLIYQFRELMHVDCSVAYHIMSFGKRNGGLAYWGQPVRTWSDEQVDKANSRADFIELRLGVRYGR